MRLQVCAGYITLLIVTVSCAVQVHSQVVRTEGGEGTVANPCWRLYEFTASGYEQMSWRGQDTLSVSIIKDGNGDVVDSFDVGCTATVVSNNRQEEFYYTRKPKPGGDYLCDTGRHFHQLDENIRLKRIGFNAFLKLNHEIYDNMEAMTGIPQFDAAGVPKDDLPSIEKKLWGASLQLTTWNRGSMRGTTSYEKDAISKNSDWSFTFSDLGPINGFWQFDYRTNFEPDDAPISIVGDWGGSSPDGSSIGTSLGSFSDEIYGSGLREIGCGLPPGYVFSDISDATELLSNVDSFPSPMGYSFNEWSEVYIRHFDEV